MWLLWTPVRDGYLSGLLDKLSGYSVEDSFGDQYVFQDI